MCCLSLWVWKTTKYKSIRTRECNILLIRVKNASLLRNKVNGDGKKTEKEETVREELSNPSCNVNSAFGIKFCIFARGSLKWLRNSKCCKANFSVVIDNTNNFGEPTCGVVWRKFDWFDFILFKFLTLKWTVVDFLMLKLHVEEITTITEISWSSVIWVWQKRMLRFQEAKPCSYFGPWSSSILVCP